MITLILFVSGLFLLTVSGPVARFLALEAVVEQFAGMIGILVVISGVVLVLQVYLQGVNYVQQRIRLARRTRAAIADLAVLSEEEQEVIRFCVQRQRRTIPGRDSWDILALVEKGLLDVGGGKSLGRQATACTIPEPVWQYLTDKCVNAERRFAFPAPPSRRPAASSSDSTRTSPTATRQPDQADFAETLDLGAEGHIRGRQQ